MDKSEKDKKVRINIDLTSTAKTKLDHLQKELDLPTCVEVIRRGISLLEFITKKEQEGYSLYVENPEKGIREKIKFL